MNYKKKNNIRDTELMILFCKGNEEAFNKLMEKNFKRVINIIRRFIRNPHDVEDLAQEVFLRVYKSKKNYKPQAKFHTWLYRIVSNLCLNYIRDNKYRTFYSIYLKDNEKDTSTSIQIEDKEDTPFKVLIKQEIKDRIEAALKSLPPKQRMAIILSKYENLSYKEIAEVMNTSVQSVKSLLNRAKNNLKKILIRNLNKDER